MVTQLKNYKHIVGFQIICILLSNCLFGFWTNSANASFVLSFSESGDLHSLFTVAPGNTSPVLSVYLVPSAGETRLATVGLFSAGATVAIQQGAGLSNYNPASAVYESHWTDTTASFAKYDSTLARVQFQGLRTTTPISVSAGSAIKIGSFSMIGGNDGLSTNLSLSLNGLVSDSILLDDFSQIGPNELGNNHLVFGSATLQSITAVPEPSSIIAAACLAGGFVTYRICRSRRKRRKVLIVQNL